MQADNDSLAMIEEAIEDGDYESRMSALVKSALDQWGETELRRIIHGMLKGEKGKRVLDELRGDD